jgi:hypothetical protein
MPNYHTYLFIPFKSQNKTNSTVNLKWKIFLSASFLLTIFNLFSLLSVFIKWKHKKRYKL